jgi:hypothetical protein
MNSETLTLLAGALLSLGFSYVPGLSAWYARLGATPDDGGTRKRLVMLALLAVAASAAFGLGCAGWGGLFGLDLACNQAGAAGLLRALVLAVTANQAAFAISPRRSSRRPAATRG